MDQEIFNSESFWGLIGSGLAFVAIGASAPSWKRISLLLSVFCFGLAGFILFKPMVESHGWVLGIYVITLVLGFGVAWRASNKSSVETRAGQASLAIVGQAEPVITGISTAPFIDLDWVDYTRSLWCDGNKFNNPIRGRYNLGWAGLMKVTNTGNILARDLTARVYVDGDELPCYWISINHEEAPRVDIGSVQRSFHLIDDGEAFLAVSKFRFGVGWSALGPLTNDLSCLTETGRDLADRIITVRFKSGLFLKFFTVVLGEDDEEFPRLESGDQLNNPTTLHSSMASRQSQSP